MQQADKNITATVKTSRLSINRINVNLIAVVSIVVVIVILMVCLLALLSRFDRLTLDKDGDGVEFLGTQNAQAKRDCDIETVYSMLDAQCETVCQQTGLFVSKHGICVNALAFNQQVVENNCDPKKGVLAYLLGDPQFGSTRMQCLSIDVGVQPDNVNGKNTICVNGTIDIDYVKTFPQLASCECISPSDDSNVLAEVAPTSVIRLRGVCVDRRLTPLFETNDLLYSQNSLTRI